MQTVREWYSDIYDEAASMGVDILDYDIERGQYIDTRYTQTVAAMAETAYCDHGYSSSLGIDAEYFLAGNIDSNEFLDSVDSYFLEMLRDAAPHN